MNEPGVGFVVHGSGEAVFGPAQLFVCDLAHSPEMAGRPGWLVSPARLTTPEAWNLGLRGLNEDWIIFTSAGVDPSEVAAAELAVRQRPATIFSGPNVLACRRIDALEAGGFDESLGARAALEDLARRLDGEGPFDIGVRLGSLGPWIGAARTTATRLSIVIPTYRRPADLSRLLRHLVPQVRTHGAELIVVNDGSHDDAYERTLEPYRGDLTYLPLPANLGRGGATNRGVEAVTGDWVVFTDDDVLPPADWLETLNELIATFPELDVVGGATRAVAHPAVGLVEAFTIDRRVYLPQPHFTQGTVKCLVTACLAVRTGLLRAVGALDETFPCGQDHNLTWRLREAGARIHATEDWWCAHDQAWSLKDLTSRLNEYAYWHAKQASISGSDIDLLANPAASWRGLVGRLPAHLRWTWSRSATSGVSRGRDFLYRLLDTACFMAWNQGGVRAASDMRKGRL